MRNKKIKNKRQLDEYIRELRLEKEIQKQKLLADVEVMKHGISTIESGIQAFQTVMNIFKNSGQTDMSPKERLRNVAINMGIDVLSDVLSQKMNTTSEKSSEEPQD